MHKQNKFFDGKDYKKGEFKALDPKFYPEKYRQYIAVEQGALQSVLIRSSRAKRVLEAGVGTGRLIPILAPLCEELICIDNSKLMLKMARKAAKSYLNEEFPAQVSLGDSKFAFKMAKSDTKIKIREGNLEDLSKKFPHHYFDFSCCMWNTLGNVKDEVRVLHELALVTSQSILVTVHIKRALEDRKAWYESVGVKIAKIDEKNEIFYTESGLVSKAYAPGELQRIGEKAGLKMKFGAVLQDVVFWAEFGKA